MKEYIPLVHLREREVFSKTLSFFSSVWELETLNSFPAFFVLTLFLKTFLWILIPNCFLSPLSILSLSFPLTAHFVLLLWCESYMLLPTLLRDHLGGR